MGPRPPATRMSTTSSISWTGSVSPGRAGWSRCRSLATSRARGAPRPSITQFDDFLAREVPLIEASPAFGSDGVILITFDEGTSNRGLGHGHQFAGGGNVAFLALGPLVKAGLYDATYDHYSFLRTLEDG